MRNQKMQEREQKVKTFQEMECVITSANLGWLRTILQRAAIFCRAADFLPTPAISLASP